MLLSPASALIGLGRSAVLQPDLPRAILLNPLVPDEDGFAQSHIVKGQCNECYTILLSRDQDAIAESVLRFTSHIPKIS